MLKCPALSSFLSEVRPRKRLFLTTNLSSLFSSSSYNSAASFFDIVAAIL